MDIKSEVLLVFDNIGQKIKDRTERSFLWECVGAGVVGLAVLVVTMPWGVLLGPLAATLLIWLSYRSNLKTYALGQMVEDLDILAGRMTLEQAMGTAPLLGSRPSTVRIICGNCGYEYQGSGSDGKGCPKCSSTYRIYPRDDQ